MTESFFERLCREKQTEGWQFVAYEGLTRTRFSQEATFVEIPYQSEDNLRAKYVAIAQQQMPFSHFEVELLLDENTDKLRRLREISTEDEYKEMIRNLREKDRFYFVFIREIAKDDAMRVLKKKESIP